MFKTESEPTSLSHAVVCCELEVIKIILIANENKALQDFPTIKKNISSNAELTKLNQIKCNW